MKTQSVAVKTRRSVQVDTNTDEMLLKVGFAVIGISSVAIGIWAAASLIGGMVASGGPVELLTSWFIAIKG